MKQLFLFMAALCCAVSMSAADKYVVAGVEALCGSHWNTTDENNLMTEANGVYTKVYANVPVGKNYQFKVVKNGSEWFGDATDGNVTFNVTAACDVTITFKPASKEITVTGAGVKLPTDLTIDAICAVGAGTDAWLNGANWDVAAAANKMAEVSPKVYQITYAGVPAGEYKVKFAANGSWADNWGHADDKNSITETTEIDAKYNGSDINIKHIFAQADITLKIDLTDFNYPKKTGGKISITITEKAETSALENTEADSNVARKIVENGQIYILRDGVRYNIFGAQVQ